MAFPVLASIVSQESVEKNNDKKLSAVDMEA